MAEGFLVGLVAGLSVALPLGAVAVLLLREGLEFGRRVGVAAAAGIAAADALFATVAVILGPAVGALIARHQRGIQLLAAAVLALVAAVGIARTTVQRRRVPETDERVAAAVGASTRSAGGAFLRFLVITLVNPLTVIYFAVVATGVAAVVQSPAEATAFVVGVLVGSGGWQLTLAIVGGSLSGRISERARWMSSVAGYALVLVIALVLVAAP
jgi:threonine/homoserine/homoserine lactone efflux protein